MDGGTGILSSPTSPSSWPISPMAPRSRKKISGFRCGAEDGSLRPCETNMVKHRHFRLTALNGGHYLSTAAKSFITNALGGHLCGFRRHHASLSAPGHLIVEKGGRALSSATTMTRWVFALLLHGQAMLQRQAGKPIGAGEAGASRLPCPAGRRTSASPRRRWARQGAFEHALSYSRSASSSASPSQPNRHRLQTGGYGSSKLYAAPGSSSTRGGAEGSTRHGVLAWRRCTPRTALGLLMPQIAHGDGSFLGGMGRPHRGPPR